MTKKCDDSPYMSVTEVVETYGVTRNFLARLRLHKKGPAWVRTDGGRQRNRVVDDIDGPMPRPRKRVLYVRTTMYDPRRHEGGK